MNNTANNHFELDSSDLISFVLKNIKPLVIVTIIGAIVSIIVAFTITPRFKSTVIMFPASSSSISNDLLSTNNSRKNILKFGEEEEVEQMLQVLHSDRIRDRIIEKFNLLEHYEIDSTEQYKLTKLHKKFGDNVTFKRTEFMSIEIEVLDSDPELAADIANDIASLVDTAMSKMQKNRAKMVLGIVERQYFDLIDQIKVMEDSIDIIRSKGVNNYESQAEVFNDALATAIIQGKTTNIKKLEEKISILSKYGGQYVAIRDRLIYEIERLSNLKQKYIEAKIDAEHELPYKYIVDGAVAAEKKSKPIRWLIVSLSTFSSFVFALILLILIDVLRNHPMITKAIK